VRKQDYRMTVLGDGEECLPWSVVLLGTNRKDADTTIEAFRHKVRGASRRSLRYLTIFLRRILMHRP